ncbi:hypothetical protein [Paractinoplanes lichenicola]|uniref:Uncharacterized protein n=1 Tax=Paractinoplanes lichenicola TaxID=2802976 RepID=A0ABS1VF88_9ACTN|nr:hypothetical protein [Actinoplanes lichenicola]MBL7253373.1 hypothetical protein [Actinoplanes lichenicola]
MRTTTRWRLAIPLILLSGLFLAGSVVGASLYWSRWSAGERFITVFLAVMFAANVGISVSIGTDRKITDTPWLRLGTVALFFLLACGVTLVRRNL